MTEPPNCDLSVVVPAHNAALTLGAQLDALAAQQFEGVWEIVVVDNASSDATADIVTDYAARASPRTTGPTIRLVQTTDGSGPSHARNVGIAASRSGRVACCDADDVVGTGWAAAMHDALGRHRFVAGALELDRLNPAWLVAGRGRSIEMRPIDYGGVAFPHGCNFGVDRSLFLAHRFDEGWRAGEEIDLARRLRAEGVECVFVPEAVVHYRYREGFTATFRQARLSGRAHRRLAATTDNAAADRTARRIIWLVLRSPRLATRSGRIRWAWVAGDVVGRLDRPSVARSTAS